MDKEILSKLESAVKSVTDNINNFRLHEAAQDLYQFIWYELADVYVEKSKAQLADEKLKQPTLNTLYYILNTSLKLLHPFMPFVTEVIWGEIGNKGLLMIEKYPAK